MLRDLNVSPSGRRVCGTPKLGVRGAAIPSTGQHGPSIIYPSLSLPADANKFYRAKLNSGQSYLERTIFQWSFGGYFDPRVAGTTGQLLIDSNLWKHVDFAPFAAYSQFDSSTISSLAQQLTVASKSTVICN